MNTFTLTHTTKLNPSFNRRRLLGRIGKRASRLSPAAFALYQKLYTASMVCKSKPEVQLIEAQETFFRFRVDDSYEVEVNFCSSLKTAYKLTYKLARAIESGLDMQYFDPFINHHGEQIFFLSAFALSEPLDMAFVYQMMK